MSLAMGIDIGGSTLRVALVDERGKIELSAKSTIDRPSPDDLLEALGVLLRQKFSDYADIIARAPIGVGMAGLLWQATGDVSVAPNLGWRDVSFGYKLREFFARPVRLVNDCNAITYGEAKAGAAKGKEDVMAVFVGTGVGMGVVKGGALFEGADGLASELGHTKIASPEEGRLCGCGARGCLEAYASGGVLPELLAEKIEAGLDSRLLQDGDQSRIDAYRLEEAVGVDDPASVAVFADVAEALGRAIANGVALFNPRALVLGGGVLYYAPTLAGQVQDRLWAHVPEPHQKKLEVVGSKLGDDAGIIGAALLARDERYEQ